MSVPEALATTIRILLMFSIVLAHQWVPRPWVRPAPSGTPHGHPWAPLGTHRSAGGGAGTRPEFRNPNNNPIIVSILPGDAALIRAPTSSQESPLSSKVAPSGSQPSASNPHKFLRDLNFYGTGKNIEICACLNLEVLCVPEGLVHSIGILEAPGVFLARRWPKS